MASSIFNLFNGNNGMNVNNMMNQGFVNNPMLGRFGNIQNFMSQFNQFRNNFQGDPKQQVQQLISSGRMSQSQFNQLSQMATQLQNMLMGK